MRTIGLLGGMSWESTREYYRILNESVREARGGLFSAPILMHSFEFNTIHELQNPEGWPQAENMLAQAALGMERGGAEAIMICTNLMHRCAPVIEAQIGIPLLHIADAVGDCITANGQKKVGLLGARGTMEEPFYAQRLAQHGIEVVTPEQDERDFIQQTIFGELCQGQFSEPTRQRYLEIISGLAAKGAQGVVLGCTEIEQLILPEHTSLKLYPSAELHARAGARFVLGEEQVQAAA